MVLDFVTIFKSFLGSRKVVKKLFWFSMSHIKPFLVLDLLARTGKVSENDTETRFIRSTFFYRVAVSSKKLVSSLGMDVKLWVLVYEYLLFPHTPHSGPLLFTFKEKKSFNCFVAGDCFKTSKFFSKNC